MKKILVFIVALAMGVGVANAAVRDGNSAPRGGGATTQSVQKRISTTTKPDRSIAPRTTVLGQQTSRSATTSLSQRGTTGRTSVKSTVKNVAARTGTNDDTISVNETRTGAEYETCKTAYFTCMDQFCGLKNDDYRRCSCSNRVSSLATARESLIETGEQITIFTESLDTVGMTAAQAKALHTATEGENALTNDSSASKALLQAILNSIRGGDTTVGGKYSTLNSIDLSFDTATAFGTSDNGQIIASYNGQNLYSAVYPQCRNAVRDDCNDASLQRAVTAYLMAIEQDCNTVQTAIEQKQKELKYAVRESSALLDLARVENRQKHNSDDFTTCVNNVESAILSEEVCGTNYHKCLDNGEFIDISTGAPITGVVEFNKLAELLSFDNDADAANQKLSKTTNNKQFVIAFEKKTKKFAEPALDKCRDISDTVWEEYLDKAMLAIYYAQRAKVAEIKQGCFDFISQCYESTDKSITTAMSKLLGDNAVILQPSKITLGAELCSDYVGSCKNMFGETDIIQDYVDIRKEADLLSACRAVVKQCFDKYGGSGYENFYYPYSGLFNSGSALNWFTLSSFGLNGSETQHVTSPCAQQLADIEACQDKVEQAFGGFDMFEVDCSSRNDKKECQIAAGTNTNVFQYGTGYTDNSNYYVKNRQPRSVGVATEIYNQIIDTLSTQCRNLQGRFIEPQFLQTSQTYNPDNYCQLNALNQINDADGLYHDLYSAYGIAAYNPGDNTSGNKNENICPRDYSLSVETQTWGSCSCWENGGRRSKNGRSATCVAALPACTDTGTTCSDGANDSACEGDDINMSTTAVSTAFSNPSYWCKRTQSVAVDAKNRVCPIGFNKLDTFGNCSNDANLAPDAYFNTLISEGS
ncbi:MAG: hypothetical protein J5679_02500 [Alphaproteobacteria bacterium]|nr:hypothetical protein [Alphaproteobacteria bacterium]